MVRNYPNFQLLPKEVGEARPEEHQFLSFVMLSGKMCGVKLLHITSRTAWAQAEERQRDYTDPSLELEGFIHCSTPAQVLTPANERFAHRTDLVLLVIDPDLVPAELVFEDSYGSGTEYPHIYGTIPLAAVTHVLDFPCNADGTFALPALPDLT